MSLRTLFCMIFLLASLASCGSKSSSSISSSAASGAEIANFANLEELKEALNEQAVACGELNNACPGFSAKLAFWGNNGENGFYLGVCSGSLYKNKYIITNSHCIPEELKAGNSCKDQLKVLFPRTNTYAAQEAKCARIVQSYKQDDGQTDLAVIELDRSVARDSVTIAPNAFIENSSVTAYTMDPSKFDKNMGYIYKKSCTLSIDNMYTMSTDKDNKEALIYGPNCVIIGGNSGSALLNQNGQMLAAVFARIDQEALVKLFIKQKIHYTTLSPMGVAQNIGCVKDITSDSGMGCDMRNPNMSDLNNTIERSIEAQNLRGVSDAQIEYQVASGFKLKLKQVALASSDRGLESFRDNWTKTLFEKTSEIAHHIIITFVKR